MLVKKKIKKWKRKTLNAFQLSKPHLNNRTSTNIFFWLIFGSGTAMKRTTFQVYNYTFTNLALIYRVLEFRTLYSPPQQNLFYWHKVSWKIHVNYYIWNLDVNYLKISSIWFHGHPIMVNIKKIKKNAWIQPHSQSKYVTKMTASSRWISMEKRKAASFLRTNAANQQTENIQCWVKKSQKKQQNIEDMYSSSPP